MNDISRRNLLKVSGTAALGLGAFSITAKGDRIQGKQLKVVVVGAHPDDPETGCGGIISLLASEGHEVVAAYLTRGEAGVGGKTHDEAAQIRTNEALEACKIMNARAEFVGQIDGGCEITAVRYSEMYDLVKAEMPDIVFTHWPVDQHRDHRICSILVYDAWVRLKKSFALYYYEVCTGEQTQNFSPTDFVDITSVIEQKRKACYCHASQNMVEGYKQYHGPMEKFRGMQANCQYAEAFVKHDQSSAMIRL